MPESHPCEPTDPCLTTHLLRTSPGPDTDIDERTRTQSFRTRNASRVDERQRSVGGLCLLPWLPPCHPHLSGFCSWALHATTCRTPGRRNEPSGQGLSGTATIARGGRPIDGPERMVLEMGLERTSGSGRGLSRPLLHSRYWKGSQVQLTTSFNEHCTSLKQGQRPMGQG